MATIPMTEAEKYRAAILARLRGSPRNVERDERARAQRQARTAELIKRREQATCESDKLAAKIEAEKSKLQKLDEKYRSVLLDPNKTDQAVRLRMEAEVLKERISSLESDQTKKRQEIQASQVEQEPDRSQRKASKRG
jgi:hypothetical protein